MTVRFENSITMIPISQIQVLNPRERGKKRFHQITANISALGLKKPVTVTPAGNKNGEPLYYLVCGQGRLEAYTVLGQEEIPCIIVEGSKEDLLLMSLAENIARRQHSSVELIRDIGILKDRGYSPSEIAKKTDLDVTYIRGILKLLDKGEERLLHAVEKGVLPISIALTIATSDDKAVQTALQEAYENNDLRGVALIQVRRIIDKRRNGGKVSRTAPRATSGVSPKSLVQTYQDETNRQQALVRKSKACESRLLMAVSAFKEVWTNDAFQSLLRSEQLDRMPPFLANRVRTGSVRS